MNLEFRNSENNEKPPSGNPHLLIPFAGLVVLEHGIILVQLFLKESL